jgi:predicted component of type VI protein secretion system
MVLDGDRGPWRRALVLGSASIADMVIRATDKWTKQKRAEARNAAAEMRAVRPCRMAKSARREVEKTFGL